MVLPPSNIPIPMICSNWKEQIFPKSFWLLDRLNDRRRTLHLSRLLSLIISKHIQFLHFYTNTSQYKSKSVIQLKVHGNQSPQPTQNLCIYSEFLSFLFYIADFWQTFWVIWENGSNWSNLRLKMKIFALGRLKNHKVPHLHPNSTMFMPLDRLQLKLYAFSGKFNFFLF